MTLHVERITPTQQKARQLHNRLDQQIKARAKIDSPIKCLSASERSVRFMPPPPFVSLEFAPMPALTVTLWVDHEVLPLGRPIIGGKLRIEDIQLAVARHFQVKMVDILGQRRFVQATWARQVAMFLSCRLTWLSLPVIGHHFGGRDHTTVLHGKRKIERLSLIDPQLAMDIDTITVDLSERFVIPTEPVT